MYDAEDPRIARIVADGLRHAEVDDVAPLAAVDGWRDVAALEAEARLVSIPEIGDPEGAYARCENE